MRMEGYRATDIARLLGQNRQSVRSALYPSTHESQTQRARRRRQDPAYQAKDRARGQPARQRARQGTEARTASMARCWWRPSRARTILPGTRLPLRFGTLEFAGSRQTLVLNHCLRRFCYPRGSS